MTSVAGLVALLSTVRQPLVPVYRCAEVMALSGPEVVGRATRIVPPAPGGEMIRLNVVFTDWQGFEPSPLDSEYAEIGTFLAVDRRTVDQWIESKARILTFQGGGWTNLDDPKERFFDAKLRPISSVEAFITAMRRARQAHPEIERIAAFTRSMTLEEAKSLKVPAGSRVQVPWDREVERWSIRGLA
ncbi:MAG: hypothetical protein JST35_00005, partial [Armatimonadetes bacterium]|nr:hypothetical protein [Armatimonadota bacterium]